MSRPARHPRLLAAAALALLSALSWGCKQETGDPADEGAAAVEAAPSAGSGGSIWKRRCSDCHTREEHQGLDADDIRAALRDVPQMARIRKAVPAAEIEALARELAGK